MASDSDNSSVHSGLNLSFESSEYEPESPQEVENIIEEEVVSEGDDREYEVQEVFNLEVEPYQYEPVLGDGEVEPEVEPIEGREERLVNLVWCSCDHCSIMPTIRECSCCKENQKVTDRMDELEEKISCITDHPGFHTVCLDVHVLRVAAFHYHQQYGAIEGPAHQIHERYRYIAYRQFVRWCWGYLGRFVRVPLPACVVMKIRETFPGAEYAGFKYPNIDI